jgi:hypothetical protein
VVENLDAALDRLSNAPLHPGLSSIEEVVLGRLHERVSATPRQGIGIGGAAAVAALILGIATSNPVESTAAPDISSPFAPSSPLSLSKLLTASR